MFFRQVELRRRYCITFVSFLYKRIVLKWLAELPTFKILVNAGVTTSFVVSMSVCSICWIGIILLFWTNKKMFKLKYNATIKLTYRYQVSRGSSKFSLAIK